MCALLLTIQEHTHLEQWTHTTHLEQWTHTTHLEQWTHTWSSGHTHTPGAAEHTHTPTWSSGTHTTHTHTHTHTWSSGTHTHTHTHLEQWAPHTHTHLEQSRSGAGEQLEVRCLVKGLTSVVDNSCRSREPTTSDYKSNALSIRPRLHLDYNLQLYCLLHIQCGSVKSNVILIKIYKHISHTQLHLKFLQMSDFSLRYE